MTKEELREKRNLAIENLNYAIAILGSDELYIDELEKEIAELKEQNTNLQEMLKTERSVTCKEEYLKKVTELEQENAELKAGRSEWHKLSEKYPEADKLVRVRLMSGMEHICETCYYEPTEDEIGYGKLVINFYELNGEWVDDNEIIAWCEIPTFTDKE